MEEALMRNQNNAIGNPEDQAQRNKKKHSVLWWIFVGWWWSVIKAFFKIGMAMGGGAKEDHYKF